MRRFHRLISLLVTFCMVTSMLPTAAFATETSVPAETEVQDSAEVLVEESVETENSTTTTSANEDTIAYPVEGGNIYFDPETGTITDCDGTVTVANIPSSIDGVSVTSIGGGAFYGCASLKNVAIPECITNIGNGAFADCVNLTNVRIPDGPTHIQPHTFNGCTNLKTVTIPDSVLYISGFAFYNCNNLVDIIIPKGTRSIGDHAFYNTAITHINIPEGVTEIERGAFNECKKLVEIAIPSSVTSIGEFAETYFSSFSGCAALMDITVAPNNPNYISLDGVLFDKQLTVLLQFPAGRIGNYRIPNGVTKIECSSFCYSNLTSITIPNTITSIEEAAFARCDNLTDIYYCSSKEEWETIKIEDYIGIYLDELTIHYNSIGPEDEKPSESQTGSVRFFEKWDADEQVAYWGDTNSLFGIGSEVVEETDLSFLEHIDELVGTYVWVETAPRDDDLVDHNKLLRIEPTEVIVGTVTEAAIAGELPPYLSAISIDDTAYPVRENTIESPGDLKNKMVASFFYDDQVVEIVPLEVGTGYITAWSEEDKVVTIDGHQYFTNYFTDFSFVENLEEWEGIPIYYYRLTTEGETSEFSPIIKITELPEEYFLRVYAPDQDLCFPNGTSIEITCTLSRAGEMVRSWDTPAVAVDNTQVVSVSDDSLENGVYRFLVTGLEDGQANVTISDTQSGAYVNIPITIAEEEIVPLSFTLDTVPEFHPTDPWNNKILTNFYNVNGLYVKDFSCRESNGGYSISFKVYNHSFLYGSVDVYDENGKWIESEKISKYENISSLYDTMEAAYFLVADSSQGNLLNYTGHTYSEETTIEITVPKNGYFTISNNYAQSPGTYLYNTLDFIVLGVDAAIDLFVNQKVDPEPMFEAAKDTLTKTEVGEIFLKKFRSLAVKGIQNTSELAVGQAMGALATDGDAFLKSIGLDWKELLKNSYGITENIFEKLTGPVGPILSQIFSFQKYRNYGAQTIAICMSLDEQYVTINAHDDSNKKDSMTMSGVTVTPEGNLPEKDVVLQVFRIHNEESLAEMAGGEENYQLYDICFVQAGKTIQPNSTVTIRIPIPEQYDADKCVILRREDDGSWTTLDSYVDGDYLVFKTTHFSLYAIADLSGTSKHLFVEMPAVAPTCNTTGTCAYWHCITCGKDFADSAGTEELADVVIPIDPSNHAGGTEIRDAVEATDTHEGYTGDTYCLGCGEKIASGSVIPKKDSGGSSSGGGSNSSSGSSDETEEEIDPPDVPQTDVPLLDIPDGAWYESAVDYVYKKGIMSGTSDTTFSPDLATTRAMIVTILYRLEDTPIVSGGSDFTDVEIGQWYSDAIAWAAANNIVGGYGNGLFGPDDPITREQLAAILYRYAQYKGYDTTASADLSHYADLDQLSEWAQEAVAWANSEGIISGTSAVTLAPKDSATRAQAAAMMMRFCENITP